MDRQLLLKLTDRAEREANFHAYFDPLGFTARELAVLSLLYLDGEPLPGYPENITGLRISENAGAKRCGISKDTFRKAVGDLKEKGLLAIITETTPWHYLINWLKFANIEPAEAARIRVPESVCANNWSPPVAPGRPPVGGHPDSLNREIINLPVPEPLSLTPRGRPWSKTGGFTDDELRAAVARRDIPWLRWLFAEAVKRGWASDTLDARQRFLTLCHHAATSSGIHSPRAALVARMKRKLDVDRTRHESDEWAQEILREARRPSDLHNERSCVPH